MKTLGFCAEILPGQKGNFFGNFLSFGTKGYPPDDATMKVPAGGKLLRTIPIATRAQGM